MKEKMKLIIDASGLSKLKGKEREEKIYELLDKIVKKLKDEFIYSATFSLAIDSLETNSKVFQIEKGAIQQPSEIYTNFIEVK